MYFWVLFAETRSKKLFAAKGKKRQLLVLWPMVEMLAVPQPPLMTTAIYKFVMETEAVADHPAGF